MGSILAKAIIDNFKGLALLLDENQGIIECNKYASEFLNTNNLGKLDFWSSVDDKDKKRVDIELHSLRNGKEKSHLYFRLEQLKSDKWISSDWQKIKIEGISYLLVLGTVVESLEAEQIHHIETEAALKDAEVIGKMGSWWVNPLTLENHWSEGNYSIWNVDPNKKPPSVEWVLRQLHPEDAPKVLNSIRSVGSDGKTVEIKFRMRLSDKEEYRYFLTRVRPWYVNGKLTEVKGVNFEITDTVHYQDELIEKNKTLLARNEMLAKYVQMNSHDVRGPVSSILSLIEWTKIEKVDFDEFLKLLKESSYKLDETLRRINKTLQESN